MRLDLPEEVTVRVGDLSMSGSKLDKGRSVCEKSFHRMKSGPC